MKQGKSIQDLAAELARQADKRKDYVAPQGRIVAEVVGEEQRAIVLSGLNGDSYSLTEHAHNQFGEALGIPGRYYDRMRAEAPELLATNINAWLQREPAERRMLRTLDGRVRAVLSPKYRPLDNYELAQAVLPKLINLGVKVMSSELTETRMYLKCILPDLSDALPEGMTWGSGHNSIAEYGANEKGRVVAALTISNSEVGNGALRVEPSVFTTWCTNLAVMKSAAMKKYHVGRSTGETENHEVFRDETRQADDRAFFLKVGDVVEAAFNREIFAAAVQQIRNASGDKIESRELPKVVEVAVRELALPAGTQNSILTYLAQGGDMSRWGLASAITATANGLGDYEQATALEHAGGEVLAMSGGVWRQISQAA